MRPTDTPSTCRVSHVKATCLRMYRKYRANSVWTHIDPSLFTGWDGHGVGMHQSFDIGRIGIAEEDIGQFRIEQRILSTFTGGTHTM